MLKELSLIFHFGSNMWFYHKLLKVSCSYLMKRSLPFIVSTELPILFRVKKLKLRINYELSLGAKKLYFISEKALKSEPP